MSRRANLIVVLAGIFVLPGCAHMQLRWNMTHQARTLTEIYEQQVLDNLARFVCDPNSVPSFAYPNQGAADVTDGGAIGNETTWRRLGFDANLLRLNLSRNMKEAWTLTPVYDVRRLDLMRCAYQLALASAGLCSGHDGCPDCDRIQRNFYLGNPQATYDPKPELDNLAAWSWKTGRTTPGCFQAVPWLCTGDRKKVPSKCCEKKIGHYCGTYVWLAPGGQSEFGKLTMVILDYAFTPQAVQPPKPVKEVIWYFDKNGLPTAQMNAAQQMKAVVPFDAKVRLNQPGSPLPMDSPPGAPPVRDDIDRVFSQPLPAEPIPPPILSPPSGFMPLQFELYRQALTPSYP